MVLNMGACIPAHPSFSSLSAPPPPRCHQAYGPLKAMHLVRDPGTSVSKGYAFFEYQNPAVTEAAIAGLNGLLLGEKPLTVRRAESSQRIIAGMPAGSFPTAAAAIPAMQQQQQQQPGVGMAYDYAAAASAPTSASSSAYYSAGGVGAASAGGLDIMQLALQASAALFGAAAAATPAPPFAAASAAPPSPGSSPAPFAPPLNGHAAAPPPPPQVASASRSLRLLNMVTAAELQDDTEYAEIVDDLREELTTYGALAALVVPRLGPGAGSIFVQYAHAEHAAVAARALAGRKFAGNSIVAAFVDDDAVPRG